MVYEGLIMVNWGAVASIAGSALSGLGSTFSNVAGTGLSYNLQKKLMDRQARVNYEYSEKTAKNQPSWSRFGLESAGYNPMLAVQNGVSGANSNFASSQSVPSGDMSTSVSNAIDAMRLRNETLQTTSQAYLANEQAKTEGSKRENLSFQNAMLDVEKHLKDKDLSTYDRRFYSEMYEQMQRAENYRAMASVQGYNAESARISANAQRTTAEQGSLPRYLINKGESVYSSLGRPKSFTEFRRGLVNYYHNRKKS